MRLNEIIGKTKIPTVNELLASIKNGRFTKDGSKLKVDGNFSCNYSELTSLEGAPSSVGVTFSCANNELTSLKGAPSSVGGSFYCNNNMLTSLEGAPSSVGVTFSCANNELTSLKGAPSSVGVTFSCAENKLTSLEGAPSQIGGNFYCHRNKLTSISNIHKYIKEVRGYMNFEKNPIKSSVLGLVKIKGLTDVMFDNKKLEKIMNKYLPLGDIFDCQEELIEAGLEEFAEL